MDSTPYDYRSAVPTVGRAAASGRGRCGHRPRHSLWLLGPLVLTVLLAAFAIRPVVAGASQPQPQDATIVEGGSATFLCLENGTMRYWEMRRPGGSWDRVKGNPTASTRQLELYDVARGLSGYQLRAKLTRFLLNRYSRTATLTVCWIDVKHEPVDQNVNASDPVVFSAGVTSNPAAAMQWQYSSDNGGTWQDIAGATATRYAFTAAISDNGRLYRAKLVAGAATKTTSGARLTVVAPGPVITEQPKDATAQAGDWATFSADATGTPPLDVQWQYSTDGGHDFADMAGETAKTLRLRAGALNGYRYRAVFTEAGGTLAASSKCAAVTDPATLTVHGECAPIITVSPTDQQAVGNVPVTFVSQAIGVPSPTVAWQFSKDQGQTWANWASGGIYGDPTQPTLVIGNRPRWNGYLFRAVYSNTLVRNVPSGSAALTSFPAMGTYGREDEDDEEAVRDLLATGHDVTLRLGECRLAFDHVTRKGAVRSTDPDPLSRSAGLPVDIEHGAVSFLLAGRARFEGGVTISLSLAGMYRELSFEDLTDMSDLALAKRLGSRWVEIPSEIHGGRLTAEVGSLGRFIVVDRDLLRL